MEIINGYAGTIGLTPSNILSSDVAIGDVSETKSSKIFFFTGDMDLNSLYNISSESQLLTSYSSIYLGTVTTDLTYKYLKNAKKNIIKMSTPNARRFKDERYSNSTYALGTAFTKPTIGTKYKFKMYNSTLNSGFLLNGSIINVTSKKEYYNGTTYTYDIESDFFTTTGNITVTNPNAMTHSGFEVIPYGDDDKPLSNQINWCAIKVGNNTLGDKLIFTDDIGTFINPSFVNLSKRECVYGIDNILHSLKIELSEKGN